MLKRYDFSEINELAQILKKDGVICVPTDTVYGLCACINSKKAYNRLIFVKGRPKDKPFPIMCADKNQIKSIAIITEKTEKIIHAFMPGPITLILKKKEGIPDYVSNGKDTIAIRMATSDILKDLINMVKCPIFMTSANKSGEPTCKNLDEIERKFLNLDGILEGELKFNVESTIIDCSQEEIRILRHGPITLEQIKEIIE